MICPGADNDYSFPAKEQAIELCFVQRWQCWYCHRIMSPFYSIRRGHSATVEHKTPVSRGGTRMRVIQNPFRKGMNVVAACLRCNKIKGDMTHSEFVKSRAFRAIWGHDRAWEPPECLT